MHETALFLERGINVLFLVAVVVALTCAVMLMTAFTFGVLHNGDDFDFGGASGGADIVVLPAQVL
jgi:hypothetical protein